MNNQNKSIKLSAWLKHMKPHFATIATIQNMKKNEKRTFLCYDRNFYDLVGMNGQPNKIFKNCYKITYTHDKDLSGWIVFNCNDDDKTKTKWEFHLNYDTKSWYPLHNGIIPPNFEIFMFHGSDAIKHINRHYSSYSKETLVGWRGPIIPLDIVNKETCFIINDTNNL